jgi:hypothetical protein
MAALDWCEGVTWIKMAQDTNQQEAVLKTVNGYSGDKTADSLMVI